MKQRRPVIGCDLETPFPVSPLHQELQTSGNVNIHQLICIPLSFQGRPFLGSDICLQTAVKRNNLLRKIHNNEHLKGLRESSPGIEPLSYLLRFCVLSRLH